MANKNVRLGRFILDRFDQYAANRRRVDAKWNDNYNAVQQINDGDTWKVGEAAGWRSQTFLAATKNKCQAAYALICDAVLQAGRMPYTISTDKSFLSEEYGDEFERARQLCDDRISDVIERTKAERAFYRIIQSQVIYGMAWGKKVIEDVSDVRYRQVIPMVDSMGSHAVGSRRFLSEKVVSTLPTFRFVPVWSMFWDIETLDIEDMEAIIQREYVGAWRLRQMREYGEEDGFYPEAIDKAIREVGESRLSSLNHEETSSLDPRLRNIENRGRRIRVLEYWGRVPRKYLSEEIDSEDMVGIGDEVEVVCMMAGDQVIRLMQTQVEDRPYMLVMGEEDIDSPFCRGVADNAKAMQKVLNGSIRLFEDNKRTTANSGGLKKSDYLKDPITTFEPGKWYEASPDCDDVRKALMPWQFPDVGESLISVIQLASQFLDEDTMIPKISQGITDPSVSRQTATEIAVRAEKATKYMGTMVRNLDEGLIEPAIGWILDYLLEDPEFAEIAGPFRVNALGYGRYQNKVVKVQRLMQILTIVLSSEVLAEKYGVEGIIDEIMRMMEIDPNQFSTKNRELTEEEQLKIQGMAAQNEMKVAEGQARIKRFEADALKKRMEVVKGAVEAQQIAQGIENGVNGGMARVDG